MEIAPPFRPHSPSIPQHQSSRGCLQRQHCQIRGIERRERPESYINVTGSISLKYIKPDFPADYIYARPKDRNQDYLSYAIRRHSKLS
jgi:hypothetical protein